MTHPIQALLDSLTSDAQLCADGRVAAASTQANRARAESCGLGAFPFDMRRSGAASVSGLISEFDAGLDQLEARLCSAGDGPVAGSLPVIDELPRAVSTQVSGYVDDPGSSQLVGDRPAAASVRGTSSNAGRAREVDTPVAPTPLRPRSEWKANLITAGAALLVVIVILVLVSAFA